MDKEIVELLDTAIKIGLGALIAGLTTYLLSLSNYNKEKEKDKRQKTISILEEIALKLQAADHKIEKSLHPYWNQVLESELDVSSIPAKQSLPILLEAIEFTGHAKALSSLIRMNKLRELIDKLGKSINVIYEDTAQINLMYDEEHTDDANKKLKEISRTFSMCFDEIGNLYCDS